MRDVIETTTDNEDRPRLSTHQKALKTNLDPVRYGTFAEIGAGQESPGGFSKSGPQRAPSRSPSPPMT